MTEPVAGTPAAPPVRPSRRGLILAVVAAIVVTGAGLRTILTWGEVSTDNAQVDGHVVTVGARVPGVVAEVAVREGQEVHAGDILARLDPADLDARLAAARADVDAATAARDAAQANLAALTGTTAANLSGASAGVKSAQAAIGAAEDQVTQAQAGLAAAAARATQAAADRQRAEQLFTSGGMTRQAVDAAVTADTSAAAARDQAAAALSAARSNVIAARERLGQSLAQEAQARTGDAQVQASLAQLKAADARLAQSQANGDAATLQRAYADIKAPFDAVVARRAIEVGQYVAPGAGLFGLVGTDEVWVVANFKETQIAELAPGQPVEVAVDGLGGEVFDGTVEAVTGATGARFALIPPDNSSGNFTKVVQRVPVRIALPPEATRRVRPGESVIVTVHTK